jgi:hypothetical protein
VTASLYQHKLKAGGQIGVNNTWSVAGRAGAAMVLCEDLILANQSAPSACDSIPLSDGLGVAVLSLAAVGAVIELAGIFMMRKQLRVHDSLPLIMISISAQVFNVVAILQLGPNTETSCLVRPLVVNLSFTLGCSSLVEHLVASRLHVRGATNRKAFRNISVAVLIETILQITWVVADETPRLAPVNALQAPPFWSSPRMCAP